MVNRDLNPDQIGKKKKIPVEEGEDCIDQK